MVTGKKKASALESQDEPAPVVRKGVVASPAGDDPRAEAKARKPTRKAKKAKPGDLSPRNPKNLRNPRSLRSQNLDADAKHHPDVADKLWKLRK